MTTRSDETKTASSSAVGERVAALRELAESDPQAAQDAIWAWFARVGKDLPGAAAEAELAELFCCGTPGEAVDGQTEGMVVGWTTPAAGLDTAGRAVRAFAAEATKRMDVWVGKRFVREEQRGTNTVTAVVHLARLIAPTYGLRRADGRWEGFDMRTWVDAGTLDPDTQVLVIDYSQNNPWPMSRIRDELVEIVPGTYLGKMIWIQDGGNEQLAYFALKTPVEA